MIVLTLDQLSAVFPQTNPATLGKFIDPLNKCFERFNIDSSLRVRAFLAQVGHESQEFKRLSENLNYSVRGLRSVFRKYFPTEELAKKYARKPELIANRVYANRLGNGNEASGDGWKYRGRGLIQVTGKYNYQSVSDFFGLTLPQTIKFLEKPEGAVLSAGWYWDLKRLNDLADIQAIKTITRRINGGTNGLEDRVNIYKRSRFIIQ